MLFSLLNRAAIAASADMIAARAASPDAFKDGIKTAFRTRAPIEAYFRKFGSTAKKFDYHPYPGLYSGYVKIQGVDEFLSVIFNEPDRGAVVTSYFPEIDSGQDVLGLIAKRIFCEEIVSTYADNARKIGYKPPPWPMQ